MAIVLIFVGLAFSLILLLWGGSLLAQAWLYQSPADRMVPRSVVCGSVLAFFLTLWCGLERLTPGKYDALFSFSSTEAIPIQSFFAIQKNAAGVEKKIEFVKKPGGNGKSLDFTDAKGQPWKRNSSEWMVVALEVQEKDKAEPTRFNTKLDRNGNFPKDADPLIFIDASGRKIGSDALGFIYRNKSGLFVANIFLNFLHLALWIGALWYGMRFNFWHAVSGAFFIWILIMLAILPVLFNQVH